MNTYLLGYLSPKHWASAAIQRKDETEELVRLIIEQEKVYDFCLIDDVLDFLEIKSEKIKDAAVVLKKLKDGYVSAGGKWSDELSDYDEVQELLNQRIEKLQEERKDMNSLQGDYAVSVMTEDELRAVATDLKRKEQRKGVKR